MKRSMAWLVALCAFGTLFIGSNLFAADNPNKITILYDAFGDDASMTKDWGFSALIEISGKKILFDAGDNSAIFENNVRAKGLDIRSIDFVVLSHRHSDHMAGLAHVLAVNPRVKIFAPKETFGIYGSSLPSSFYRKDETLPSDMRYYGGQPPQTMIFGRAWPDANIELIDQTTEVMPGVTLIALVSNTPGTLELKELSLAVKTSDGIVLVVGCSHPGIDKIVEAAAKIDPNIYLIAGGFHLVTATDESIAKIVSILKDTYRVAYVAPGHCTGEPTFAALKRAFGSSYIYAGLGRTLALNNLKVDQKRGEAPALDGGDVQTYRKLAQRNDPFGIGRFHRQLAGIAD
jgi:7,8-dihydropterin-6-yl-methyl-4-(beta-D-ribofuranosyl)aminobenzene 5'-phosphate synthase